MAMVDLGIVASSIIVITKYYLGSLLFLASFGNLNCDYLVDVIVVYYAMRL